MRGDNENSSGYRSIAAQVLVACAALVLGGCANSYGAAVRADLRAAQGGTAAGQRSGDTTPALDGTLRAYLAHALANSPEIRAAFERWRAATLRVAGARRLPEPTIRYSYYLRSVETRVGPQQHRLSLAQTFPWPTALSANADAAAETARVAQRDFDAKVLRVHRAVANAYWRLWLLQEEHNLTIEHDLVLETLAGTVRGRVKTGASSLADLNQVELMVAKHHDHHGRHQEALRVARAELRRAVGQGLGPHRLLAIDQPRGGLPVPGVATLQSDAQQHPNVEAFVHAARAADAEAKVHAGRARPRFMVGLDWIQTGGARVPGVSDSSKDALIVSAGLGVPLWGRAYRDDIESSRAEAAAQRADAEAARQQATADVQEVLAVIRDAHRRVELYRGTLIPQAETTFRSVLGSYQSGRSTVASALLAQKELLELQLELVRSQSAHQRGWASLEEVVARPVAVATGEQRQ